MTILTFLFILAALPLGLVLGYYLHRFIASRRAISAETKAEKIISEAKEKQKELLYEAKEKALKVLEEVEKDEQERRRELNFLQQRISKRESLFDQKLLDLEDKQQALYKKAEVVEKLKQEIEEAKTEQMAKLEKIAGLSKQEAKDVLLENVERQAKDDLLGRIRKLENESREELEKRAKNMLSLVIERCSTPHAAETTTSIINLPSEEMKGRIIGREGRNIKTLEQLTGVEIVVDDTPETILVSAFNPIRRQVAKKALEKLIVDGRIHPGRIEEKVEEAKKELAIEIKKAGEEAAYEVGIAGLDTKLVQLVGRLKFRTSYGQNVLQHSIEVAHLSALLAGELKANVSVAKKAGFLHDIGKALDQEVEGTHPELGADVARKFNLPVEIVTPILTHHQDNPPTLEAVIVKAADAISGARPGARKDTYELYIKRLEELENLAKSFEGVERTYAIQAGREIRVFINPAKIDDLEAFKLARQIANKIELELKYPGEIKVMIIRETRLIEYAR